VSADRREPVGFAAAFLLAAAPAAAGPGLHRGSSDFVARARGPRGPDDAPDDAPDAAPHDEAEDGPRTSIRFKVWRVAADAFERRAPRDELCSGRAPRVAAQAGRSRCGGEQECGGEADRLVGREHRRDRLVGDAEQDWALGGERDQRRLEPARGDRVGAGDRGGRAVLPVATEYTPRVCCGR